MPKKLTQEEYEKKLFEKFNGEYTCLGKYINNSTKILHRHNKPECNYHEWEVLPANLICKIPKAGCPICGREKNVISQRKKLEEYKKEFYNKYKDEYTILSDEYINNKSKILIKCNKCGNILEKTAYHSLNDKNLCSCSITREKNRHINNENYKEFLPNNIIPLENYIGYNIKIKHKCLICNNMWYSTPHNILNGNNCPNCKKNKLKLRNHSAKSNFFEKLGDDYVLESEYIKSNSKILIKHKLCNSIFETTPHKFTSCPICYKNYTSSEEFEEKFKKLSNGEYILKSEYKTRKDKIKIYHKECKNYYETTPDNFLKGCRCPYCNTKSKGEDIIRNILKDKKIKFIEQKKFKDCKYKRELPFDFQVFLNNEDFILIEYDGIQHFKESFYNENLLVQQKRDQIKDMYCKTHNIKLYRIPYTKFNQIESELNSILLENNYP